MYSTDPDIHLYSEKHVPPCLWGKDLDLYLNFNLLAKTSERM